MTVEIDLACDEGVRCAINADEMTRLIDLVLRQEGVERGCMLSLSVVSDAHMRELNAEWRGIDRTTDVLSLECERPDDPDLAPGEPCELGDVVLAPAYIEAQAAGFGTTPADETRLLIVHGVLHLLGYDHEEDDEAERMESREDELLALVHTDGDLSGVALTRHEDD